MKGGIIGRRVQHERTFPVEGSAVLGAGRAPDIDEIGIVVDTAVSPAPTGGYWYLLIAHDDGSLSVWEHGRARLIGDDGAPYR